jgi:hypothetical protein
MIFTILGLLIGIALIAAGAYYRIKEKGDQDSAKIYGAFIAVGVVITIGVIIKIILAGF